MKKKLQAQNCKSPLGCILYQTVEMMWLGRMQQMLGYAARVFRHCYANIIVMQWSSVIWRHWWAQIAFPFPTVGVKRVVFNVGADNGSCDYTHSFCYNGVGKASCHLFGNWLPRTACAIVIMDNIPYLEIKDVGAPDVIWWEGRRIWSR